MTDQVVVAGGLVLAVIWSTFLALALGERAGQRRHQRRRHEASRRDKAGAAVAVKTAGIPLGATVVALAGPPAAMHIGWRGGAGDGRALRRERGGRHRSAPPGRPAPARRDGWPAAAARRFFWIPLTGFLFVLGSQPLFSWLVLTLVDAGGSTRGAGLVSATGTALG